MKGKRLRYGGILLKEGIYGVVEWCNLTKEKDDRHECDIISPIEKEVGRDQDGSILLDEEGRVAKRVLHLADTDAFNDPACVVPDIGGPPNRYYYIEPRARWADSFEE